MSEDLRIICWCGGKLIISNLPPGFEDQKKILVDYFTQQHLYHGIEGGETSGVREPRTPTPPSGAASAAKQYLEEKRHNTG